LSKRQRKIESGHNRPYIDSIFLPAMYHPTTRVLALLELLQTHGRMGGAELSARLGVDRRTLRRYVGKLEDIGIRSRPSVAAPEDMP
jgi:predicted ArsR family transcriptional regulator